MSRGVTRSSVLLILAACNLLFWVAVAAGVGLAVSREVDLGVETLIRQQQATAVEAWQQVASGATKVTVAPTVPAVEPTLAPPLPTALEIGAVQTSVAQASEPSATATNAAMGSARPSPAFTVAATSMPRNEPTKDEAPTLVAAVTSTTRIRPTENLSATRVAVATATPEPPTPEPSATPVNSALLISDDTFSSLAQIGAEMNRSASGRPVLIRYSEAMLNSEITSMVENSPGLPYRNVRVDLMRDQVLLTGDVVLMGFELTTEVQGTVRVEDCRPQTEIQEISIAGVLTPGFVKDQAKEMLVEALDWYPENHPLCLEQIVLEEDRATAYGHRR